MKLNLKSIAIIFNIVSVLLVLFFVFDRGYKTQLMIYPTNQLNNIRMSAAINTAMFQTQFKQDLAKKNITENFLIKSKALISGLIVVDVFAGTQEITLQISEELKEFIKNFALNNKLMSTDNEVKLFIIKDIISYAEGELQKYSAQAASGLEILNIGVNGLFLKNLLRTQAILYVDSRLNNLDISVVYNEVSILKIMMQKLTDMVEKTGAPAKADFSFNEKMSPIVEKSYYQSMVEIAKNRDYAIRNTAPEKIEVVSSGIYSDKYGVKDIFLSFITCYLSLASIFVFIHFFWKKIEFKKNVI